MCCTGMINECCYEAHFKGLKEKAGSTGEKTLIIYTLAPPVNYIPN